MSKPDNKNTLRYVDTTVLLTLLTIFILATLL